MFGASSELASVMEFGFNGQMIYSAQCCTRTVPLCWRAIKMDVGVVMETQLSEPRDPYRQNIQRHMRDKIRDKYTAFLCITVTAVFWAFLKLCCFPLIFFLVYCFHEFICIKICKTGWVTYLQGLLVLLVNHVDLKPRLHDTTGCQTFTWLSDRFDNWFDNRVNVCIRDTTGCQTDCQTGLTTGCIVYTVGCQTGCTTRFDNRLDVCLRDTAGCETDSIQPVWQQVVSCKRGITVTSWLWRDRLSTSSASSCCGISSTRVCNRRRIARLQRNIYRASLANRQQELKKYRLCICQTE